MNRTETVEGWYISYATLEKYYYAISCINGDLLNKEKVSIWWHENKSLNKKGDIYCLSTFKTDNSNGITIIYKY